VVFLSQTPFTHAFVFANGDLNDGPAVQAALNSAAEALIIAADGGARLALGCGLMPQVVVGDMDSLTQGELKALEAQGAVIERHSVHKNETDLELALLAAVARQVATIRLFGCVGNRIDQELANIYLLMLPALTGCDTRIVDGRQTLWLIGPGKHTLQGASGDTVSLLPIGGPAVGVITEDLFYPLRDETLFMGPARGISNVMNGSTAGVTLADGHLLVVHTAGKA
jgi:thiamine pyrophosphokinase